MSNSYLLHEEAIGYSLFALKDNSLSVVADGEANQASIANFNFFKDYVKLLSIAPFPNPTISLANQTAISEGKLHEYLEAFIEQNLGSEKKAKLAVLDKTHLGRAIEKRWSNIVTFSGTPVVEISRGVKLHFHKFASVDAEIAVEDIEKAQQGLAFAYSRSAVKFNANKSSNTIIQASAMLETLDKDINTYAMRAREWYSLHFPELNTLVKGHELYVATVIVIGDRSSILEDEESMLQKLTEVLQDELLAKDIVAAAKQSIGCDFSEHDKQQLMMFIKRLSSFQNYRTQLSHCLKKKMQTVAPNVNVLVGEQLGAKLITKAGSLVAFSKNPASTIQILGAEKALFRALKTRGKTPKYGYLFNASIVTKSSAKNKGRIARGLANKLAIASRIDAFTQNPSSEYGEAMKKQLEERHAYYEHGQKIQFEKNAVVMERIADNVEKEAGKKRKRKDITPDNVNEDIEEKDVEEEADKKKKKKKH